MLLAGCYPSDVLKKIPDGEFQRYLTDEYDYNGDHKLAKNEALAASDMYIGIYFEGKNLDGIHYLENLEELTAENSVLERIDVSRNRHLKKITLDHMRSLRELKIGPQIEELILRYQSPEQVIFTSTENLKTYINCYSNKLHTLGISSAPQLTWLNVSYNQISELDLSGFPNLERFYCDGNNLTSLDLSSNLNLKSVTICDNPQLRVLWLKKGQQIEGINVNRNNRYAIDSQVEIKYKD